MMSQPRKDLLDALELLGDQYPNWRLGQLVANVAGMADVGVWDVEDEQLLAAAKNHLDSKSRPLPVND